MAAPVGRGAGMNLSLFGIAGLQLELRSGDNLGQIDAELDLLR